MMTTEVEVKPVDSEQANRYLRIYNADIDWIPHIKDLYIRLQKSDPEEAKLELKKRLTCSILLPYHERNTIQDPPQNLLFYCHKWSQYSGGDKWLDEFQKVWKKDRDNDEIRNKCLNIGVIYPVQYNPNTREAFNWLMNQASESGAITEDNKAAVTKNMQNLVYAYGGVVITNIIFNRPEYKTKINNILNWRSGYFFERLIHDIYSESDLIKIKTHEINKVKNVDSKLVKTIRAKEQE